jgi:hypothetical protein
MKKFILFCMLTFSICSLHATPEAQDSDILLEFPPPHVVPVSFEAPAAPVADDSGLNTIFLTVFGTFAALVAFIPVLVQFLRRFIFPNATGLAAQLFSWFVGLAITIAGWALNIGFLSDLSIWLALLYGGGACLAANGIFDTGLIEALIGTTTRVIKVK